ncbi:ABC transporter ATP-binding protein [Bythopirellula polymerisocia]|uniref:Putative ABC transporter ATP-binding protein YxlF n=1 Tax=Bythopirellula polymerisocia TaxID=2528003 RepID=A0A5C6CWC1_9BACT|nr:ABC transporter ATP-binding protein [Bythopirellula polymerisocia]TWU27276.1 putative ABC transporter ATP-binding protein YxlF [Bythopirellula polymerisocia]
MIHFEDVTRTFGNRTAVERLNLSVGKGELVALLGHNGAGKTTSIKMLVGLLQPSFGQVKVGPYVVSESMREASRLIGYVPDQPFLYDKLSAREFLEFVGELYGLTASEVRTAVQREVERFQLGEFMDRLTESYSHGMRQRTVFAAALIHEPEVLVVDEPMVGLDPQCIRLVKDFLRAYADNGKTVLMSTHTLGIAEEIADRVAVMNSSRLVFEGTVAQLRERVPGVLGTLESLYLALTDVSVFDGNSNGDFRSHSESPVLEP